MTNRKWMSLAIVACLLSANSSLRRRAVAAETSATARPEVAKVGKVYRGQEGLVVSILRLGPERDRTFLVKFEGIDHSWSGRIMRMKQVNAGTGHDLVVDHKGREFHAIIEREVWGYKQVQVYLPSTKGDGVYLSYNEKLSKELRPDSLLDEYLRQGKDQTTKE